MLPPCPIVEVVRPTKLFDGSTWRLIRVQSDRSTGESREAEASAVGADRSSRAFVASMSAKVIPSAPVPPLMLVVKVAESPLGEMAVE